MNTMTDINSAFIKCVEVNDLDTTIKLLESGADVHINNDRALKLSVQTGHLDVVIELLKFGADVNAGVGNGYYSVLELGVINGHLNVVTKLLESGADVHFDDDYALRSCARNNRYKMMELLLENGANLHCHDKRILKDLQRSFNEKIADIILPYCSTSDYKYFPESYIAARIIPTKSANAIKN